MNQIVNHKNSQIFFGILFLCLLICSICNYQYNILIHVPEIFLALTVCIFLVLEIIGAFNASFGFHMKILSSFPAEEREVILSFDDGPSLHTEKILDVLKETGCRAVFFVIGEKISGNEKILKRIIEEGHEIGNHSFSHSLKFTFFSADKVSEDILRCSDVIESTVGIRPKYFRPPFGVVNPNIAEAVSFLNLKAVGWNIRSFDTVLRNKDKILRRVKKQIRPGSILLFHDTVDDIHLLVRDLSEYMKQNGYLTVGLDRL